MDFKGKLGPLPVYMWGLLIGGLILLVVYWRSSHSKIAAAGSAAANGPVVTNPVDAIDGAFGGMGTGNGSPTTTPVNNAGSLNTNGTWLTQSVAYLSGTGAAPVAVQTALQKYLGGSALTAADQNYVNMAVSKYGVPPDGTQTPTAVSPDPGSAFVIGGSDPTSTGGPYDHYWRDQTGRIFGVRADGSMQWLTLEQWTALGRPAVQTNLGGAYQ